MQTPAGTVAPRRQLVGCGADSSTISPPIVATCSACHDSQTGKKVAIKKVHKAFQDERDAKMLLREIKLLRHLSHENIIPLLDIQPPRSRAWCSDRRKCPTAAQ